MQTACSSSCWKQGLSHTCSPFTEAGWLWGGIQLKVRKPTCPLIYKPQRCSQYPGSLKHSIRLLKLCICSLADPVICKRTEVPGSHWNWLKLGIEPTRYRNISSFTHFLALPSGLSGFGAFISQVGHVMPLLTRSWNQPVLLTWSGCQWTLLCCIAGISALFKVLQGSSTGGFVKMDLFQRGCDCCIYMVWIPSVILQCALMAGTLAMKSQ